MKLPKIFQTAVNESGKLMKIASKKSPVLWSLVAAGGVVGSIIFTRQATMKAVERMEEVRNEDDYEEPDTKFDAAKEEAKETWQYYIPVVIVAGLTIVSIVESNRIYIKRIAILTDAYRMSENLRKEYQEKVREMFGEKKEEQVQTSLAQDKLDKDEINERFVYATGHGNSLIKDCFTCRYFYSDPESIRQVRNQLDAKLIADDYICLNELYRKLDLELIDYGNDFGWNIERVDRNYLTDIRLIPGTASDGRPCHVMTYVVELGYDRYEDS